MNGEVKPKSFCTEKVTLEKKLTIERKFGIKRHKRPFCSIVKKKIWLMFENLWKEGYVESITHKVMVIRAKEYLGCDKETIRAYLGYIPRIRRRKTTGEGYEAGQRRDGYLYEFGYATRKGNVWFLHHQNIPGYPYEYVESLEQPFIVCQRGEGLERSSYGVKFLSLGESGQSVVSRGNEEATERDKQQQHTEREKFSRVKVFEGLSGEESRVLEVAADPPLNPGLYGAKPLKREGEQP